MSVPGAQKRIVEAAGRPELGHIHGDRLLDIPFPKSVRDELVACGDAETHHVLPNSGWVSIFLRKEEDVPRAIRLLERSFSLAAERRASRNGG